MLNYNIKIQDETRIVELAGSLSTAAVEKFMSSMKNIVERESLILNLENLGFITTSGMKSLVEISMHARSRGHRLILLWPSKDFTRTAETMDVYNIFIFADSVEEGITKIRYFTK